MSAPPPAPPTPSAPPAPAAAAAPAKSGSRAVLWIVLGVGGCIGAFLLVLVVLAVIGGMTFRRRVAEEQHRLIALHIHEEEDELTVYLENDPDRAQRVRTVWDELQKQADAGELKMDESQRLSDEVRKITDDGQVTSDEADEAIAMGAKIAGVQP